MAPWDRPQQSVSDDVGAARGEKADELARRVLRRALSPEALRRYGLDEETAVRLGRVLHACAAGFHDAVLRLTMSALRRDELLEAVWAAFLQLWEAVAHTHVPTAVQRLFRERESAVQAATYASAELVRAERERDELRTRVEAVAMDSLRRLSHERKLSADNCALGGEVAALQGATNELAARLNRLTRAGDVSALHATALEHALAAANREVKAQATMIEQLTARLASHDCKHAKRATAEAATQATAGAHTIASSLHEPTETEAAEAAAAADAASAARVAALEGRLRDADKCLALLRGRHEATRSELAAALQDAERGAAERDALATRLASLQQETGSGCDSVRRGTQEGADNRETGLEEEPWRHSQQPQESERQLPARIDAATQACDQHLHAELRATRRETMVLRMISTLQARRSSSLSARAGQLQEALSSSELREESRSAEIESLRRALTDALGSAQALQTQVALETGRADALTAALRTSAGALAAARWRAAVRGVRDACAQAAASRASAAREQRGVDWATHRLHATEAELSDSKALVSELEAQLREQTALAAQTQSSLLALTQQGCACDATLQTLALSVGDAAAAVELDFAALRDVWDAVDGQNGVDSDDGGTQSPAERSSRQTDDVPTALDGCRVLAEAVARLEWSRSRLSSLCTRILPRVSHVHGESQRLRSRLAKAETDAEALAAAVRDLQAENRDVVGRAAALQAAAAEGVRAAEAAAAEAQAALEQVERQLQGAVAAAEERDAALGACRRAREVLEGELERARAALELAARRQAEDDAKAASVAAELVEVKSAASQLSAVNEDLEERLRAVSARCDLASAALRESDAELASVRGELALAQLLATQVDAAAREVDRLQAELVVREREREAANERVKALEHELAAARSDRAAAVEAWAQGKAELAALTAEMNASEGRQVATLAALEAATACHKNEVLELEGRLAAAHQRERALDARCDSLEQDFHALLRKAAPPQAPLAAAPQTARPAAVKDSRVEMLTAQLVAAHRALEGALEGVQRLEQRCLQLRSGAAAASGSIEAKLAAFADRVDDTLRFVSTALEGYDRAYERAHIDALYKGLLLTLAGRAPVGEPSHHDSERPSAGIASAVSSVDESQHDAEPRLAESRARPQMERREEHQLAKAADNRAQALRRELAALEGELAAVTKGKGELQAEVAELRAEREAAASTVAELAQTRLHAHELQLKYNRACARLLRGAILLQMKASAPNVRAELRASQERCATLEITARDLRERVSQLETEAAALRSAGEAAAAARDHATRQRDAASAQVQELEAALRRVRNMLAEVQTARDELQVKLYRERLKAKPPFQES